MIPITDGEEIQAIQTPSAAVSPVILFYKLALYKLNIIKIECGKLFPVGTLDPRFKEVLPTSLNSSPPFIPEPLGDEFRPPNPPARLPRNSPRPAQKEIPIFLEGWEQLADAYDQISSPDPGNMRD